MKKRGLTIVVLVIVAVILGVIIVDFMGNRPDRRGKNPYALEVKQYREVDEDLISYKETRNFSLGLLIASDMSYHKNTLYISGYSSLVLLPLEGSLATLHGLLAGAAGGGGVGRRVGGGGGG